MVGNVHRGAPERHHAVAHVLVDRAAVRRIRSVSRLNTLLSNSCSFVGSMVSDILVKPRMSQNSTVSSLLVGLHGVAVGVLDHLVDQLGRHVGAEQVGQLALAAAFDEIAVTHVQGECGEAITRAAPSGSTRP